MGYTESVRKQQTLYIKNPEAHRLAKQLSKQMGVTITEAVIGALKHQMAAKRRSIDMEKIKEIQARIAAMPVLDPRTPDEILGYDEFGLPS